MKKPEKVEMYLNNEDKEQLIEIDEDILNLLLAAPNTNKSKLKLYALKLLIVFM